MGACRVQHKGYSEVGTRFVGVIDGRKVGGQGEKGEGMKKDRLVVTKGSQRRKIQHREHRE